MKLLIFIAYRELDIIQLMCNWQYTDKNLFQLIALVYINIKVISTCFG